MTRSPSHLRAPARQWLYALGAIAFAMLGCLPIPVKQESLAFPAMTLTVKDQEGAALEGVKVQLYRHEIAPHWRPEALGERTTTTDANGNAAFEHELHDKQTYPLMMHGVGFDAWHICLEKQGYGATYHVLFHQGHQVISIADERVRATYEQLHDGAVLRDVQVTLTKLDAVDADGDENGEAKDAADPPKTSCSSTMASRVSPYAEIEGIDIKPRYVPSE